MLLAKASEDEIKSDILPMIFSTLESNSIQGQVRAVANYLTLLLHYSCSFTLRIVHMFIHDIYARSDRLLVLRLGFKIYFLKTKIKIVN